MLPKLGRHELSTILCLYNVLQNFGLTNLNTLTALKRLVLVNYS